MVQVKWYEDLQIKLCGCEVTELTGKISEQQVGEDM